MADSNRGGAWAVIFALFAVGNLANGLWMLASPVHWYINLPANVPGTGPINEHFIRDIGCIFTLVGVALAVAVFRPRFRLTALLFATGFYVAHALVHVYDSLRGLLPPEQWRFDLLPVYGAAIVLVVLSVLLARSENDRRRGA
ncbi:MAG: hypothetical protein AAF500_16650 [Myxococcota bacterium]